jgi:flagellar basal body-associated protein FliL
LENPRLPGNLKGKIQKHALMATVLSACLKRREIMYIILIISIIIVLVVLLLSVVTTSKAYTYKHTVDPIENNPHLKNQEGENTEEEQTETENKA